MYTVRGGAFLVTFASPTAAVLCALEVQALRERDGAHEARPVRFALRQVVSTGEVWLEPDDVCGAPVDLAGRLQEALGDSGVFLTESTWLVMDKARLPAECVGSVDGEALPEGVRVFRARALMPGEGASRGGAGWSGEARRRVAQVTLVLRGLMRRGRDVTWKQAGRGGLVLGLLAAPLGAVLGWLWPSRAEVALDALAELPEAERATKAREVEALLAREDDVGVRAFLQGRLREVLGEPRVAVEDYRASAEAGHREAVTRLVELLGHVECPVRAAAARTLGGLSVEEAREPLRKLAERGPDGGSDRCGSRRAAAQALTKLEGTPR
ncbi:hypothetical protein JY651_51005 [Pyxidicoccus parkwayensis]|uniref:HEAT repeat domain-containing protein n=1 Tax=Pyxidicoccus parkwayensis TaxID=2813578 RepID=A0ABX7NXZ0_9BACT|nr:hypothetical protein [Pyxidicoccus parkwaysis]QSQ23316.1 hypothetical protein JY651_51005 [Pyxidicoccus parkwaysis]